MKKRWYSSGPAKRANPVDSVIPIDRDVHLFCTPHLLYDQILFRARDMVTHWKCPRPRVLGRRAWSPPRTTIPMPVSTIRRADCNNHFNREHCRHHHHLLVRRPCTPSSNGRGRKIDSRPLGRRRLCLVSGARPAYLITMKAKNPTRKIPRRLGFVGSTFPGERKRNIRGQLRERRRRGKGEMQRMESWSLHCIRRLIILE